jgi:ADP-ribose pyrophosphatase YjhB (NUDIX family)
MIFMDKKFLIRCRAIIIYEGKLLVVRHTPESVFYALPGGRLEWGEDMKECMSRELEEELGVRGDVGELLYVNTFIDNDTQSVEFFFEIKNSADYANANRPVGSHANEIHELRWVSKNDDVGILPPGIDKDLKEGSLEPESVRFIRG